jgi:PKD repeat protein
MVAGGNVFINYSNAGGSCSSSGGGTCDSGQTITFDAGSFQYNYDLCPHTFTWDFGDGSEPTTGRKGVTHVFTTTSPRVFTVSLTIANSGQSVTTTKSVSVNGIRGQAPDSIDFTFTNLSLNGIIIPNAYVFTPVSVPAGRVQVWKWDFGDGSSATCPAAGDVQCTSATTGAVQHAFRNANNYVITLTVKTPDSPGVVAKHPLQTSPAKRRGVGH